MDFVPFVQKNDGDPGSHFGGPLLEWGGGGEGGEFEKLSKVYESRNPRSNEIAKTNSKRTTKFQIPKQKKTNVIAVLRFWDLEFRIFLLRI